MFCMVPDEIILYENEDEIVEPIYKQVPKEITQPPKSPDKN